MFKKIFVNNSQIYIPSTLSTSAAVVEHGVLKRFLAAAFNLFFLVAASPPQVSASPPGNKNRFSDDASEEQ